MISWWVSLSKRCSARRRCLAILDFITTWGHKGLPKKVQEGCGVVGQFSPGRASRGSCQSFTWVETDLLLPQALPYMCLARPGPCAVVPARMPQARPCRPMRSGRQGERRHCRHAWPHTPRSRPAGGLGAWERCARRPVRRWAWCCGYGGGEASASSLAS